MPAPAPRRRRPPRATSFRATSFRAAWAGRSGRALGIAAGVLIDRACADPQRLHPVAGFGALAARTETLLYPRAGNPQAQRRRGVVYLMGLVGIPTLGAYLLERQIRSCPGVGRVVGEMCAGGVITWVALGGTSLVRVARQIAAALEAGDSEQARRLLPWLCGRDPKQLDTAEIARAVVESLAENTSDAQVAPLLWASVAGLPGVVMYRTTNTLDAMVGHLSRRYRHFGWAAARFDDALNYPAARFGGLLTVSAALALDADAAGARRAWRADAAKHPSPNAGVMEATAAGALGVVLGGRTPYPYGVQQRPLLGVGGRPVEVADIGRAISVEQAVQCAAALVAVGIAVAVAACGAAWEVRARRAG